MGDGGCALALGHLTCFGGNQLVDFSVMWGITKTDDPVLALFHPYKGEAKVWTMAASMKEADIPREKF